MINYDFSLTPELQTMAKQVTQLAKSKGLDFDPIEFLLIEPEKLNALAAYGGFPVRYPHWRFGMDFNKLHKGYKHGTSKIYELVINNNPVYAYLLKGNTIVEQKIVMAHVCGHADFFKNNIWFAHTHKNMIDQMANNGNRIRRIMEAQNESEVENFIDICLSIENLIDPYTLFSIKNETKPLEDYEAKAITIPKLPAKEYMDQHINTPEYVKEQKEKIEVQNKKEKHLPEKPERDILKFLIQHAPLNRWQRDILNVIRDESYYFLPQRQTKLFNEGFATFWHTRLLTQHLLNDAEVVDYCDIHSGVVAQGKHLNPYKLGVELLRDIEDRWNRGAHGLEWEKCQDSDTLKGWDTKENKGIEKLFQLRKTHNDIGLIDEFLTEDFCRRNRLFVFKNVEVHGSAYTLETSKEFKEIKNTLLSQLSNGGNPIIELVNANFENKGEILLRHVFYGQELDEKQAAETMSGIYKIWTRPIHIETISQDKVTTWHHDGASFWMTNQDEPVISD